RIDDNTVKVAGTIEQLRQAGGQSKTALLSAGDNISASLFASAIQDDKPTIDVLNALDLRASAVGNHEFDRGLADLTGRVNQLANFPYLAANVYAKGTTDNLPELPASTVLNIDGVRVGVIGAVTQETPTLVSPGGVATIDFGDTVAAVNREASRLKSSNLADVIVAEYHDGAAQTSSLAAATANSAPFDAIVNLSSADVDVIMTGHTHLAYAWDGPIPGQPGRTRPILQTGSYGANIGKVTLTVDKTNMSVLSYTVDNIARTQVTDAELVSTYPRVAQVQTIVDAALTHAQAIGSQTVGQVSGDITTAHTGSFVGGVWTGGSRDNRGEASALGTLVGNALRDTLANLPQGAQLGLVNPGGLRAELLYGTNGDITFAQANAVLPFNNTLSVVTLTGQQLVRVLEQQWQRDAAGNVPSRPYLQLGLSDNVTYTFDESDDPAHPGAKIGHILSVYINGQLVDPNAEYRVGTFSFMAEGGDNFWEMANAVKITDTGLLDWQGWVDYLRDVSQAGPIRPNFARTGVQVSGIPTQGATPGSTVNLTVSRLNTPSLGSQEVTSVNAQLAGVDLGDFPVVNGVAQLSLPIPSAASDQLDLLITANVNATVARLPVPVAAPASADDLRFLGILVSMYDVFDATPSRWTPSTYDPFHQAMLEARAALANPTVSAAVVTDLNTRLTVLAQGLVEAVDTSLLAGLITAAQAILDNRNNYVSTNLSALEAAVAQAQSVLANASTQIQVDQAVQALLDVMVRVHKLGDKTLLRALVAMVRSWDENRFTPSTWAPVAAALAVADAALADANASEFVVEDATAGIETAVAGLVLRSAKAGLASAITVARSILANAALYVPSTLVGLDAAVDAAQLVYDNVEASQEAVTAAQTQLIIQIAKAKLRNTTQSPL
ncbi:MAG: bifunctional metallophosphatase/5'-nucleotidase, partial [Bifidobacteriaceae bacterium]|nr:bifunctional metallophosphatase/5'-nucleotidase [Bifidobacteriaceae bacterium]